MLNHALPQTDSTRAKDLESQIQARVTTELQSLLASSKDRYSSKSQAVSDEPFTPPAPPKHPESHPPGFAEKPLLNRVWEKFTGNTDADTNSQISRPDLDSQAVQSDIEKLRRKLNGARKPREMDKDVKDAQEHVVECLRLNDRRPLDCWKEIERFKEEVAKLEADFVARNGA